MKTFRKISVNDMATVRKGLHLTLAHPEEV